MSFWLGGRWEWGIVRGLGDDFKEDDVEEHGISSLNLVIEIFARIIFR